MVEVSVEVAVEDSVEDSVEDEVVGVEAEEAIGVPSALVEASAEAAVEDSVEDEVVSVEAEEATDVSSALIAASVEVAVEDSVEGSFEVEDLAEDAGGTVEVEEGLTEEDFDNPSQHRPKSDRHPFPQYFSVVPQ